MSWEYTKHDIELAKAVKFKLSHKPSEGTDHDPPPGSNGGKIKDGRIEFQFPPKITSDNRKGTWKEIDKPGAEPTFEFTRSGAREISLNWTYVIDGGQWDVDRVTRNIRALRGYFARSRNQGSNHDNLVVNFEMWSVGGTGGKPNKDNNNRDMTCLIKSIDVKYGDTIVTPGPRASVYVNTSRIAQSFFLRSDITVDLRLWTQGVGEGDSTGDDTLEKVNGLYPSLNPAWY